MATESTHPLESFSHPTPLCSTHRPESGDGKGKKVLWHFYYPVSVVAQRRYIDLEFGTKEHYAIVVTGCPPQQRCDVVAGFKKVADAMLAYGIV